MNLRLWLMILSSIEKAGSGPPCSKKYTTSSRWEVLDLLAIVHFCALGPQFSMYADLFFRTRGNSACWRWGFWTTLYEKHTTSTCRITPILHVRKTHLAYGSVSVSSIQRLVLEHLARKTYHIYMHSGPNSTCMQNTFFVHAAILHVNIWRWGVLAQLVLKTYHIYTRGLRLLCNKKKISI